MTSACKAAAYPELTVRLSGYNWKCKIHIHVLITERPDYHLRQFVRLYLKTMKGTPENLRVPAMILDWFEAAIPIAQKEQEAASQRFVYGYCLPDAPRYEQGRRLPDASPGEKKKIEAENRKLTAEVKAARQTLYRLERKKEIFLEECAKRHIQIVKE